MKTKQFILTKVAFATLALLALTFTSCDKDDDNEGDENTPPISQSSSYEVELLDIKATSISDAENGELEIYGEISATHVLGSSPDYVVMWSATQQGYLSVVNSDMSIGSKTVFTVDNGDIEASEIRLSADLMEFDWSNPDDPVGIETSTIQLSEITDFRIIELFLNDTGGHHVRVRFTVKPV
jgi:hypothetical protein